MQKSNEKKILGTVPKNYQDIESFWDCPEFSKGKNKGITLIALIITIIVMLILVGVTINVALNGGLFEKASEASKQTQMAADRETLQSAVLAALDNNLEIPNAKAISDNLGTDWTVIGADGGPYTCTSPKGNTFTVTKKGEIESNGNGNNSGGGTATALHSYYYDKTNGDVIKCSKHESETYTIGETFSYTPSTENASVTITGDRSGVSAGITSGYLTASDYETDGNQIIAQDTTLTWVVFGIDENTNKLLITSSAPTLNTVTLYGAQAYNNGSEIVNEICGMYSGENATAEGMTIEDVNTFLGFEIPEGKTGSCYNGGGEIWVSGTVADMVNIPIYNDSTTNVWERIQERATRLYNEGKTIIPDGNMESLEATLTALGGYKIDGYYYEKTETTATDTRKHVIFGASDDLNYILASYGVSIDNRMAFFSPFVVLEGNVGSDDEMAEYGEDGEVSTVSTLPVRPVVSIIPTV